MRKILVIAIAVAVLFSVMPLFAGGQEEQAEAGGEGETIELTMFEYQNVTDESEVAT